MTWAGHSTMDITVSVATEGQDEPWAQATFTFVALNQVPANPPIILL